MTTTKKIVLLALGVTVVGAAAYFLLKKKTSSSARSLSSGDAAADSTSDQNGTRWTSVKTEKNWHRAWGRAVNNNDKGATGVVNPKITVQTPDGKPYGPEYTGNADGTWEIFIPMNDYILTITAPGYLEYKNPSSKVDNGYNLFMRKQGEY